MADGHSHLPGDPDAPTLTSPRTRRVLVGVLVAIAAATVAGLVLLWPSDAPEIRFDTGFSIELVDATVSQVQLVQCAGVGDTGGIRCEEITARVESGTPRGEQAVFELYPTPGNPRLERGDQVVLSYAPEAPPQLAYQFADFQRTTPMLVLGLLFVVAVVALGRWKGVRALLGVGISLVVIVVFLLPALLAGEPPLMLALVAASTIAYLALFLAHGFNERTAVALLGTLAALALTGVLAWLFVDLARFTGLASEEATLLQASSGLVDFRGLLLAGIMIGALGVLDDVTVTQVSAVWELKLADERFGPLDLYKRAVNIGRDHIASVVNTLALAYAGAALPLLLLFSQASRSFSDVVTGEAVAVEIVRTLVGSIGLVAAVPITTGLAALVIGTATVPSTSSESASPSRRGRGRGRRDPFWDEALYDDSTGWSEESEAEPDDGSETPTT
ncbi:MAG: YibE/F family protein [Acidimicrobiales bacterium]